ncbi:MAG: tRNA preQ1(34) S-adenosylmethionine ribosyltransferase-isomerase QueA [Chthonomonas sp.]|nr:tRNA preQ1(34) S-adenosylmethionine ribosyltransferase-isomerase QueA [Chthonomonas sp.]
MIAQEPLADRAASRMLCLDRATGELADRHFRDLVNLLHPGDVLVVNNTRVSAVRLFGRRATGGACEVLLTKRLTSRQYRAMVKPAKRLTVGTTVHFDGGFQATVVAEEGTSFRVLEFPDDESVAAALQTGVVPLPPYITQKLTERERYQTVFNSHGESSAAPTAGLHFTPEILAEIQRKGIQRVEVNLEVGVDTFRPVMVDDIRDHEMHGEVCTISDEAAQLINQRTGRCIAVGTTSVRTLESFADANGQVQSGEQLTRICIAPGYEWRVVQGMLTNFHMPRTTMLLMLAAMTGRDPLMAAYRHAIAERYRFLSFGDCMFIANS